MLKRTLTILCAALFVLGSALPALALPVETPMTYDVRTVTEGLTETFADIRLMDATSGNTLAFTDAPKMNKYRYALPKGETLTLYYYGTAADMQTSKAYIDGYAMVHNGQTVYAATELPYTWYTDNACSLFLYCGTSKSVNKTLTAFTGNKPIGGYFAGDKWTKPFPAASQNANATVIADTPVYRGASTKREKLGSLWKGTRVRILAQAYDNMDWAIIQSEDKWSCVPMRSLRPDEGFAPVHMVPPSDCGHLGCYVLTATVNVRTGPGTNYNTLGKIKKGTIIAVEEIRDGWARDRWFETYGPAWINVKYLRMDDD